MSVSSVLDESVFKKWNSVSRTENLEKFSISEMKAPASNVSVRLDLYPDRKSHSGGMESDAGEKNKGEESDFSKWNDAEQLNNQVVFINPEWDEIEEEKAGIPSFLGSITPSFSVEKPIIPSQVAEFVVTDTESVSSLTVSLDEFAEESEEIVAVISDSEAEILNQMEAGRTGEKPARKPSDPFAAEELRSWKESDESGKANSMSDLPVVATHSDRGKSHLEIFKKRGGAGGGNGGDLMDPSKLMKASCYVMQNGKITKPFYIVKNSILREDAIYKNINKIDESPIKRGFKIHNSNSTNVEEERNLLSLGRNAARKRENFREPQAAKFGRNQEFIRIIEHPARTKNKIAGKTTENKNHHFHHQEFPGIKKPQQQQQQQQQGVADGGGSVFRRNPSSSSDSLGNSCDGEDLMWLLDFKLDDLFSESSLPALSQLDDSLDQYTEFPGKFVDVDGSVSNFSESDADDKIRVEIGCQTETMSARPPNKFGNNKINGGSGKQQQHKVEGKSSESSLPNRTFSDLKCSENRKPPFTYTELIECALQEKGPLTVSEIYNWISETFPYYKSWDDRWKNSVRHNLSINPYFRKGTKARQGSGHLWTVNKSEDNSKINNWKRHRFHEFEEFSKRLRYTGELEKQESSECVSPNRIIDETELATASIEDKENRRLHRDVLMAACIDNNFISTANVSLEQSAEEILSGVKKNVEVQYLEPVKSPCEDDFLNPISKEILMGECGLLNQIELNLTAETGEHLSIVDGMTDSEHIFGIPDELNFHYDIPSHAPQLLPLAK